MTPVQNRPQVPTTITIQKPLSLMIASVAPVGCGECYWRAALNSASDMASSPSARLSKYSSYDVNIVLPSAVWSVGHASVLSFQLSERFSPAALANHPGLRAPRAATSWASCLFAAA